MELRQLKYFLKAKELMNFTEAAQALNISQSTLSQQIKQLEIELDILFFNRVGKRIYLTEAGLLFAPFAEKCVRSERESILMLKDLKQLKRGSLKIGISYGLRTSLISAIKSFSDKYPLVKLEILFETSQYLLEKLSCSAIDIVLSYKEEHPNKLFKYEALYQSDMHLVTAAHSTVSEMERINLFQLSQLPLAMPINGYSTTNYVMHAFDALGLVPDVRLTINDIPTLIEVVQQGNLHTVLAEATILHSSGLKSIPITGIDMARTASLITLKDAYETEAMRKFREEVS